MSWRPVQKPRWFDAECAWYETCLRLVGTTSKEGKCLSAALTKSLGYIWHRVVGHGLRMTALLGGTNMHFAEVHLPWPFAQDTQLTEESVAKFVHDLIELRARAAMQLHPSLKQGVTGEHTLSIAQGLEIAATVKLSDMQPRKRTRVELDEACPAAAVVWGHVVNTIASAEVVPCTASCELEVVDEAHRRAEEEVANALAKAERLRAEAQAELQRAEDWKAEVERLAAVRKASANEVLRQAREAVYRAAEDECMALSAADQADETADLAARKAADEQVVADRAAEEATALRAAAHRASATCAAAREALRKAETYAGELCQSPLHVLAVAAAETLTPNASDFQGGQSWAVQQGYPVSAKLVGTCTRCTDVLHSLRAVCPTAPRAPADPAHRQGTGLDQGRSGSPQLRQAVEAVCACPWHGR